MSQTERRHLHKPKRLRPLGNYEHGKIPCVPGVIPDRSQESIDEAMRQAHHVLPFIPGTQVCVRQYEIEPGLLTVRALFGEAAERAVRTMLVARGGSDPAIVISSREPHEHEGSECHG